MKRNVSFSFIFMILASCSSNSEDREINKKIQNINSEIEKNMNKKPIQKFDKKDFGNRIWKDTTRL